MNKYDMGFSETGSPRAVGLGIWIDVTVSVLADWGSRVARPSSFGFKDFVEFRGLGWLGVYESHKRKQKKNEPLNPAVLSASKIYSRTRGRSTKKVRKLEPPQTPALRISWWVLKKKKYIYTHRPHSSSFLGFPYRILNMNPQKGTTLGPMGREREYQTAGRRLSSQNTCFSKGCYHYGLLDLKGTLYLPLIGF